MRKGWFVMKEPRSLFFGVTLIIGQGCGFYPGDDVDSEDNVEETSSSLQGTLLPGSAIPQFITPLPAIDTIVAPGDAATETTIRMCEFKANVLPPGFVPATGQYDGTWVWGYVAGAACPDANSAPRNTYIGPIIVATRGTGTTIRYVNELGQASASNVLAWKFSTDQTLHWADPLHSGAARNACARDVVLGQSPAAPCGDNYSGPIPAVVHLHGGEVPAEIDGNPEAWFTSDGAHHGHGYYNKDGVLSNEAVYTYPNTQEAAPLWFHDHALGVTRLNVYAGLAGAYLLVEPDPAKQPPANLPGPADIIPLVIQDRSFDVNGQLFLHNTPINPEHPFWVPEFVGDVIVVNGAAWPFVSLEPRRYRFLFINGSNARTYEMFLTNAQTGRAGPAMYQIGTDGGYLDTPVAIDPTQRKGLRKLVLMPGERADVIVDFAGVAPGTTLMLRNTGKAPYPAGAPPNGATTGRILAIRINCPPAGCPAADPSYDPAGGGSLRPGNPIVRLVNPTTGALATNVAIQKTRQLTLNEVLAPAVGAFPGGPTEILVNNTKFDGDSSRTYGDFTALTVNGVTTRYSELPNEGDTEVWEIVNLTADAHPIHLHLQEFQLLNRQRFAVNQYTALYEQSFPGGAYLAGFGPPLDYRPGNNPSSGGKYGGNPDVTPFLKGPVMAPAANEAGWKDTVVMYPGQVTRIAVRWAPVDLPTTTPASDRYYAFAPDGDLGYVWHCHIIDHEDNEMMRPTMMQPNPSAPQPRPFTNY